MATINNKVVWIDLTDMISWRGHFTGIQRVVHSYASRYAKDGAKFFTYDKIDNRCVEIEFSLLKAMQNPTSTVELTTRQKIKRSIGKPYYALPAQAKRILRPAVNVSNRVVRTTLHNTLDRDRPTSMFSTYENANFAHGDKVVLMGAGWNEMDCLQYLCEKKKTVDIHIIQHINDILPIYQPHLFADELPRLFTPYVELATKNASTITVISKATKNDLETFCRQKKIKVPTIKIVMLGEDSLSCPPEKPISPLPVGDFILSVGTFEIRKNYILLYQAVKLAQLEGKSFPNVVIAGRKGWLTEDLAHVIERDPFTKDKIFWLPNVSDEQLEWLQENCLFAVFPSLCEGWGLPIVESLRHGKLCLASNVSSMLEIGDGMVDYFSPYDARSCMEKIVHYASGNNALIANKNVANKYIPFTWDDSYTIFSEAVESTKD
jgi:glycosyltransferase involved in cell wall biosynthesis